MRADSERRRKPRFGALKIPAKLLANGRDIALVDFSSRGLRIESANRLDAGAAIQVTGEIEGSMGRIPVVGPCRVCWCSQAGRDLFHAGLSFDHASDIPRAPVEMLGSGIDYYETLQVSRGADADTIRRVYHLMARRYHPENLETGSDELFLQIVQANEVLSDAARRAVFDLRLASHDRARLHLFENWQRTRGAQAEMVKRQAILWRLYNQRFTDTERPWIALRDFENLMGCPREHLEFSFWVLRQGKLVSRGDGARYGITDLGAAAVEAEKDGGQPPVIFPLLTAPSYPVN